MNEENILSVETSVQNSGLSLGANTASDPVTNSDILAAIQAMEVTVDATEDAALAEPVETVQVADLMSVPISDLSLGDIATTNFLLILLLILFAVKSIVDAVRG